jgi:hypothetical protein
MATTTTIKDDIRSILKVCQSPPLHPTSSTLTLLKAISKAHREGRLEERDTKTWDMIKDKLTRIYPKGTFGDLLGERPNKAANKGTNKGTNKGSKTTNQATNNTTNRQQQQQQQRDIMEIPLPELISSVLHLQRTLSSPRLKSSSSSSSTTTTTSSRKRARSSQTSPPASSSTPSIKGLSKSIPYSALYVRRDVLEGSSEVEAFVDFAAKLHFVNVTNKHKSNATTNPNPQPPDSGDVNNSTSPTAPSSSTVTPVLTSSVSKSFSSSIVRSRYLLCTLPFYVPTSKFCLIERLIKHTRYYAASINGLDHGTMMEGGITSSETTAVEAAECLKFVVDNFGIGEGDDKHR